MNHRCRLAVFAAGALGSSALVVGCAPPAAISQGSATAAPAAVTNPGAPLTDAQRAWVDQRLRTMSLRERVGQMVTIWVLGDYTNLHDPTFDEVRRWIVEDHVGGATMSLGSPIEVAEKINVMQRLAAVPLLISSDVEPNLGRLQGGVFAPYTYTGGGATVVPNNMAIGATGNPAYAYAAGRIIGSESRAVGIRQAFAPTVDVNNNPANPVINVRSFGEDPEAVAAMAREFVRGVQGEGVAATAKHFPGHGDTDTDSHLALPVVRSDRARLATVELVPFRAAIAGGVNGVMTAHIALPAIEDDSTPATLAPRVITGLLRDSLGFRGVAFTDALSMEGVGHGYTVERSAVLAVQAGADVLLKPTDVRRAIDAVVAAVERGEITPARIERSVRAILELKARVGLADGGMVDVDWLRDVVASPAHRAMADTIARDAVTLVRDSLSLVPLAGGGRTVVITYAPELEVTAGRAFADEMRSLVRGVEIVRIAPRSGPAELDSVARRVHGAARVIVTTHVRTIEGLGRPAIPVGIAAWMDTLALREPVIVVANGNPYVIRQFPHVGSYLVTYGVSDAQERAAARALAGRAAIRGRTPISLPGFFARGEGLDRPVAVSGAAP